MAHLHRQVLRLRGALIATQALRAALEDAVGSPGPYSPLFAYYMPISHASSLAVLPAQRHHDRHADRRMVFLDTRLARANGWGSAGQCPARLVAKTPAVRERVCRVAAAEAQLGVDFTRASAQARQEPVGVSDEP